MANSQYKEYTDNQTSIVFWDVPVTIKIDNYWKLDENQTSILLLHLKKKQYYFITWRSSLSEWKNIGP